MRIGQIAYLSTLHDYVGIWLTRLEEDPYDLNLLVECYLIAGLHLSWHFVPTGANYKPGDRELRKGMPLGAMQPFQRALATALLAAGLSQQGVIKAQSIMSLEQLLLILEGAKPVNRRDPDNYFITIFGTPSAKGTRGYRIERQHLAQNYTIVDGKVSDSPSFFGSNPAEVRIGPRKGLRVLALEDDYGYDMIESLDKNQQDVAGVA